MLCLFYFFFFVFLLWYRLWQKEKKDDIPNVDMKVFFILGIIAFFLYRIIAVLFWLQKKKCN